MHCSALQWVAVCVCVYTYIQSYTHMHMYKHTQIQLSQGVADEVQIELPSWIGATHTTNTTHHALRCVAVSRCVCVCVHIYTIIQTHIHTHTTHPRSSRLVINRFLLIDRRCIQIPHRAVCFYIHTPTHTHVHTHTHTLHEHTLTHTYTHTKQLTCNFRNT